MEVLIFHLVDYIHDSEVILHHLEGIAQVGAYELVMVEVFHFYACDDLVELLT